jgi:hypothetical protein
MSAISVVALMIDKAVNLLIAELRAFIASTGGSGAIDAPDYVIPGNIAMAESQDLTPPIRQRVVASVVNVAEESTFKNAAHFERTGTGARYRNAPTYLNLFVLFSANYDNYETALRRLSQVVTFFQGKHVFTLKNTPIATFADDDEVADMRLIMELFALTFEQVNYLWASLGGKQVPFLLYKVRLVRVQADRGQDDVPLVEEIVGEEEIH